jgi:Protein of unknown function (DUF2877)
LSLVSEGPVRSALAASAIGDSAKELMARPCHGRVLSVHKAATNVELSGRVISLVPDAADRGPVNINLSPQAWSEFKSRQPEEGEAAAAEGSRLDVGGLEVSFESAVTYRSTPHPSERTISRTQLIANAETARGVVLSLGRLSGLGELLALASISPPARRLERFNVFSSAALDRLSKLEQAIGDRDPAGTEVAFRGLIGLGPGLTPSSDDTLAGMCIALWHSPDLGLARLISDRASAAVERSLGRTTKLSTEYLRQAVSGRGSESVVRLCMAVSSGGTEDVAREAARTVRIGETSGTDTALGVVLGAKLSAACRPLLWRMG